MHILSKTPTFALSNKNINPYKTSETMRTIDTFYFGKVTLCECFDDDNSMNGEGYFEVTDSKNRVIAEIYGYDIDEITEDEIENNLL